MDTLARWLIVIGVGLVALGVLFLVLARTPFLDRLGRLPGDFRFQSADGRFSCLVPLASSIVISVILTILVNLALRWLDR